MRVMKVLLRWSLRGLGATVLLGACYVGALAYPRPLFPHATHIGEFSLYASHPLPGDASDIAAEARWRVSAMEHARPGVHHRVFLCGTPRLYSVFGFLTRRSSNSLGIGLWALRAMYINETKVERMVAAGGRPRHSRFEGRTAEVIAHEIAHFNAIETLGLMPAVNLPVWKSEGYAEVQANLAAMRADPAYDVADRVALLLDDTFWGPGDTVARQLFEWQVLVEYLGEVEGLGLRGLADEALTQADARRRMIAWYETERDAS